MNMLPKKQAQELERRVENSGVVELQQDDLNPNASMGRADVISYRLTISDGPRRTNLWMNDVTAPASIRLLLGLLRKLAIEQKRQSK